MLSFDSHVHIGVAKIKNIEEAHSSLPAYNNATANTFSNYLRVSNAKGVTKCLAFPFPFNEVKRASANKYILECARKEPTLILPLLLPDDIRNIEANINDIYGIKEHFYLENSNDMLFPIYDLLQKSGKVLLIHAHRNEWKKKILEIFSNFPEIKIIIAHCARKQPFSAEGLIDNVKAILSVSKTRDNLFFETSTIRTTGTSLTELINLVGDEHILWGSDFPFYKDKDEDVYKLEYEFISSSTLSDESSEKILSENFRRLFQANNIWIRHACDHDSSTLINMLDGISGPERKLLAISAKASFLKQMLRKPRHVFVAENSKGQILGFLRKSDRPENGALIEEVYVPGNYRGSGIGRLLIESVTKALSYAEMKTYSSNAPMVNIAKKIGFTPSFTPKKTMINWRFG
jgi:predicted TIM-barrel fold metal-dependent hydrolase/predicted GNAT family acetyltransferase